MPGAQALLAVLAGGRGERLGGRKPAAVLAGRPLIGHVLEAARASGLATTVVAKATTPLPPLDCEVLLEPDEPQHPLTGLVAALAHCERAQAGRVVIVACDMPFVTGPLLAWLADHAREVARALVARVGGHTQPLLACYLPAQRGVLERALADEASLTAAVARVDPLLLGERELERFGDPALLCFGINDRADLLAAEKLLAARVS